MIRVAPVWVAALALLGARVGGAAASTLNVPSSFANIQLAINAASSGDLILVGPGTYTQNVDYSGKALAIRSVSGPNVTTISVAGGNAVIMGSNDELTGFTVTGASANFGAGVAVVGTGQLIKGNVFISNHQGAGGFGAAIGGNNASPTIVDNYFTQNTADSQFLSGVVSFVNGSSPYIANNVFYNNSARAINFTVPVSAAPVVINNTIVGNTVGIHVDNRVTALGQTYRNNIIYGNGTGLENIFGTEGPVWQNNLLFGNTAQYSGISDPTGSNGNLAANPLFVNTTDFHLLAGSPAIGAGTALLAPADDFDGNARPANHIDIGAFQTPEPTSVAFLAVGGLVLMGRRRFKCCA